MARPRRSADALRMEMASGRPSRRWKMMSATGSGGWRCCVAATRGMPPGCRLCSRDSLCASKNASAAGERSLSSYCRGSASLAARNIVVASGVSALTGGRRRWRRPEARGDSEVFLVVPQKGHTGHKSGRDTNRARIDTNRATSGARETHKQKGHRESQESGKRHRGNSRGSAPNSGRA